MGSLYDRQACSYAFWFHQRRHGVEVDSGKTTHLKLGLKVDIDYIPHLAVVVRNFQRNCFGLLFPLHGRDQLRSSREIGEP